MLLASGCVCGVKGEGLCAELVSEADAWLSDQYGQNEVAF